LSSACLPSLSFLLEKHGFRGRLLARFAIVNGPNSGAKFCAHSLAFLALTNTAICPARLVVFPRALVGFGRAAFSGV